MPKKNKKGNKKALAAAAAAAAAGKLFMKNVEQSDGAVKTNKSVTIQYDSSSPLMTIKTCDLNTNVCTTEEKPVPKGSTFPNLLSLDNEMPLPVLGAMHIQVPPAFSLIDRLLDDFPRTQLKFYNLQKEKADERVKSKSKSKSKSKNKRSSKKKKSKKVRV